MNWSEEDRVLGPAAKRTYEELRLPKRAWAKRSEDDDRDEPSRKRRDERRKR